MLTQKNSLTTRKVVLLFSSVITSLIVQLPLASQAQTIKQCKLEEVFYNPGDTVGPLVCMPDGSWQRTS